MYCTVPIIEPDRQPGVVRVAASPEIASSRRFATPKSRPWLPDFVNATFPGFKSRCTITA